MPGTEPRGFLAKLPPSFVREVRLPLNYTGMVAVEGRSAPSMRLAESEHYRTRGYACHGFPKPISRCFRPAR